MGTYYNCRITVHGNNTQERSILYERIANDDYLKPALNNWSGDIKNYYPSDKLQEISKDFNNAYILLEKVRDGYDRDPYHETVIYRGVLLNGAFHMLKRRPTMTSVRNVARQVLKSKKKP